MFDARIRPPSLDIDTLSLHSIHKHPTSAQPQRHPLTSKPHGRQRSKDVERGSPIRSRSGSNQAKDANGSAGWYWSHSPTDATPIASTTAVAPTFSRRGLSPEGRLPDDSSTQQPETSIPQRSSQYKVPRYSPLASSPPTTAPFFSSTREYRTSPSSSDLSAPRYPRRPPIAQRPSESDTDLSASELMDLLTELEPVVSASARSAQQTTGEEPSRLVRKRSFSNDASPRIPDSR